MSSRTRSITSDMQRSMTVKLDSMWQMRLSLLSTCCGRRNATAMPAPTTSLPQCSVRAAANSSSCESTESRWLLARPGVALGAGIGAPEAGAALEAMAFATFLFGMMLLPPRFRPMDSRNSCMPTTMPMSSIQMPAQASQPPIAQAHGPTTPPAAPSVDGCPSEASSSVACGTATGSSCRGPPAAPPDPSPAPPLQAGGWKVMGGASSA
mmetsp:Transcript_55031/g.172566  ORF Transcript_55031/g.172566 Transcript_55031/m.172566 type:complete len:209 (+) Transcript_55031:230-856(+)